MVRLFALCLTVLLPLLMQSCSTGDGGAGKLSGTVVYLSFEGGFYGIKGDDGKNYDPTNLPEEFRKDGLRVQFEAKQLKNQVSFHVWGNIVELVHIRKL